MCVYGKYTLVNVKVVVLIFFSLEGDASAQSGPNLFYIRAQKKLFLTEGLMHLTWNYLNFFFLKN